MKEEEPVGEDLEISSFDPGNFGNLIDCSSGSGNGSGSENALRIPASPFLPVQKSAFVLVAPSDGSISKSTTVEDGIGIPSQTWTAEAQAQTQVYIPDYYQRSVREPR